MPQVICTAGPQIGCIHKRNYEKKCNLCGLQINKAGCIYAKTPEEFIADLPEE